MVATNKAIIGSGIAKGKPITKCPPADSAQGGIEEILHIMTVPHKYARGSFRKKAAEIAFRIHKE